MFRNILVVRASLGRVYRVTKAVPAVEDIRWSVVGNVVVVGALARCALFHL